MPYNSDDWYMTAWQVEDDIAIKVEIGLNVHNRQQDKNYRILRLHKATQSPKIAIELLVLTTLSIGI